MFGHLSLNSLTLGAYRPPVAAAPDPGGDPLDFGDQDVVLGAAATIELASAFEVAYGGDASGLTYSITGGAAPVGMAIDGATLTGTPLAEKPRETVTIQATDGGSFTETATLDLGCTCKAGVPAPAFDVFHIDVAAAVSALGYSTDVTAGTAAALKTAIETAAADGGTAAAPKLHRVTWTGGDDNTMEVQCTTGTASDHSWVVVEGQGALVRNFDFSIGNIIARNWIAGGTDAEDPADPSTTAKMQFENCKLGTWWDDLSADVGTVIKNAQTGKMTFKGCHIAGATNAFAPRSTDLYLLDSLVTHYRVDGVTLFDASATAYRVRMVGNVLAHTMRNNPSAHPDIIQTGGAPEQHFQLYENILIADHATYGSTGIRLQEENHADGTLVIDMRRNVMAITGYTVMAVAPGMTGSVTIQDFVAVPAPGFGVLGMGMDPGDLTVDFDDVIVGSDWTETIGGEDIVYARTAVGIEAAFPSLTGSEVSFTEHGTAGASTVYVPDELQATYHPQSWRNAISAAFAPAGGWGTFTSPASYGGVYDWGAVPSFSAPTVSSASFDGTALTATCSATGGKLWAFVSTSATAPNFTQLRHGVNPDGTHGTDPHDDVQTFEVTGSGAQTYTLSQDASDKYVWLVYEHSNGSYSAVTEAAEVVVAPSITGVPTISGTETEGETLTATAASVTGSPTPTRTWQWERNGTPISGSTAATYTLTGDDVGATLTVVQTETNSGGADSAESAATGTIAAGSSALSATYLSTQVHNTSGATAADASFAGVALGSADSDRLIVAIVQSLTATATGVATGVTIGGVTATSRAAVKHSATSAPFVSIWTAPVPTGTTGDVVVSFGGTRYDVAVSLYSVSVASPTFVASTDSGAATGGATLDLNTTTDGVVIAGSFQQNGTVATWTGLTERAEGDIRTSEYYSTASADVTTGETPRAVSVSFTDAAMAAAALAISG